MSKSDWINRLQQADVIYLGETHDNPDHHAFQLEVINTLIKQGKKPRIGFEFFSREQSSWLLNFTEASSHSFSNLKPEKVDSLLRSRLGWQNRPDWDYYFPFIALAKEHSLDVFGADMDRGIRTRLARVTRDGLTSVELAQLPQSIYEEPDTYRQALYKDLKDGHCGMASDELVKKLYQTITIRNAFIAESIQIADPDNPDKNNPIVIILGKGHVNYNGGVVSQLSHLNPGLDQLNIGIYELPSGNSQQYIQRLTGKVNDFYHHDIYALTPQRNEPAEDHCAAFRKHGKK